MADGLDHYQLCHLVNSIFIEPLPHCITSHQPFISRWWYPHQQWFTSRLHCHENQLTNQQGSLPSFHSLHGRAAGWHQAVLAAESNATRRFSKWDNSCVSDGYMVVETGLLGLSKWLNGGSLMGLFIMVKTTIYGWIDAWWLFDGYMVISCWLVRINVRTC